MGLKMVPRWLWLAGKRKISTDSLKIFQNTIDSYNGVTISEPIHANTNPLEFGKRLKLSMDSWRNEDRKGVWIRIPISSSHLIPIAVSQGFWFHHCGSEYILLCNWIPGGKESSKLPLAASHYIGVAGFILNSKQEILMVQEKTGPAAGFGLWKLPGGLCDVGEDIHSAVVREVKEETGIDSTFHSLVAMMEGHRGTGPTRESASDLYCVCVLKASDENQSIRIQESELERSDWVPVEHALSHHKLVRPNTAIGQMYRTALSVALNLNDEKSPSATGSSSGLSQSVLPFGIGNRQVNVLRVEASQEK